MPTVIIQPIATELKIANCKKVNGVINSFFIDYCFFGAWFNSGAPTINESFIRFDIMKYIPQNVAIKKATMMLYPRSGGGLETPDNSVDGIHTVAVYELTSHFADGGVVDTASYPSYNSTVIDQREFPTGTWFEFDVSSTVQKIVNGEHENFGFTLKPLPLSVPAGSNFFYTCYGKQSGTIPQELCAKIVIEYTDALITPNNLYPENVIYKKDDEISFSWNFNGYNISDRQKSFELQYKINSGDWVIVTQITNNQYYTFAVNTFTAGTITWRVKTTDNNNTTSLYSNESTFTVVNPPVKPTITNDATVTTAKPTITWTSTNQKGYQVLIKDAENNIIWKDINENSTAKSKAIDVILANTKTYTIELKIVDNNGFWSEAEAKTINIIVNVPSKPKIVPNAIDAIAGVLSFSINKGADVVYYDVYRDDERIASQQTNDAFLDYTCISGRQHIYFVRGYNAQYGFSDSLSTVRTINIKNMILSRVADYKDYTVLKYNLVKGNSYKIERELMTFAGRADPVPEFGEHENDEIKISCFVKKLDDALEVKSMVSGKEMMLYRDSKGRKMFGTVGQLDISEDIRGKINMDFTFTKADYNEVI